MPPKKHSRASLDAALAPLIAAFGHRPNITGADVGYQWKGSKEMGDVCLRIHVDRKIPVAELEASQVFPDEFQGLPLDVIEGDYCAIREGHKQDARDYAPVLTGGITCGRLDGGTGTAGMLVIEERTGRPCLLSNWHVLAGPNGRIGDPILQPGSADAGAAPQKIVATLGNAILSEHGDAAVAPLNGSRPWFPVIRGELIGLTGIRDSRLGETLTKSGRTTGMTQGKVDGEGIYFVQYEVSPGRFERRGIRGFKLVPLTPGNPSDEEISLGGDSGSTWYSSNSREAVGLHFAGESTSAPATEFALACNMTTVANRLGFRLAEVGDVSSPEVGAPAPMPQFTPQPGNPEPNWPVPHWPWVPFPIPFPVPMPFPGQSGGFAPGWPADRLRSDGSATAELREASVDAVPQRTRKLATNVSVPNFIWPELLEALASAGITAPIKPSTKIQDVIDLNTAQFLAEVLVQHPPFGEGQNLGDGTHLPAITPMPNDFANAAKFTGVVDAISDEYRKRGVTPIWL